MLSLSKINLDLSGHIKERFGGKKYTCHEEQSKSSTVKLFMNKYVLSSVPDKKYVFVDCYNILERIKN